MPEPTWGYTAASLSGAGTVERIGRCVGIAVVNSSDSVDATFNISGGDTITVRAGRAFGFLPKTKLRDPVVTWISGAIDVIIETLR